MGTARQLREWLSWLIRIRFLVIVFLFVVELLMRRLVPARVALEYFISLVLVWGALAVFYTLLYFLNVSPPVQAYLQLSLDLAIITAIVHITGSLDSYLILLYPLVVVVASILLPRVGSFLLAALAFLLFAGTVDAAYFGLIPSPYPSPGAVWPLQAYLGINLMGLMSVWYLSSYLAHSLHLTGAALKTTAGELEELQAFNENIVQSVRSGLLTTDLDGRILLLNPAGEEILGVSSGTLRGAFIQDRFPAMAALLSSEEAARRRGELVLQTPQGEKILGLGVSPLQSRGNAAAGYVFNFQDLTELKALEGRVAQKERMVTLGRMAAAIAHEIRNPLAAIAGSIRQLARYADVGEDEKRLVDIVTRESDRLNRLVNDTLTYSRAKVTRRESVNLARLLEETLVLLRRHPRFNGKIHVEKVLPTGTVRAAVDAGQIKQVLWNLYDNALRAMPRGGTLRVQLRREDNRAHIQVSDTGRGLEPDQLNKVFEPFEAGFIGGTGLGLAIVYQIVDAHKGRVWAESVPQKGSDFHVELPLN